ncbi:MAG: hypothetical protein COU69_00515 [Candidatus Pacebacteria bacterium CG10_big_fil_rev_8_21_14_0_10_56_10]|nr:MAG: hypothetical protein COU69_00515 [Candidatus Pacebacteria bacterium CG10_big_fil_rev_8_21_14_0_10_56_10]
MNEHAPRGEKYIQDAADEANQVVVKAGEIAKEWFREHHLDRQQPDVAQTKSSSHGAASYVTKLDHHLQTVIVNKLRQTFPKFGVVAEENTTEDSLAEFTWYIDPLDGTANFVHGFPQVSIAIALCHNHQPVVSAIHFPLLDPQLFETDLYAIRGKGAFGRKLKPLQVSDNAEVGQAVYFIGSGNGQAYASPALWRQVLLTRMFESSSYQLGQIADGVNGIYLLNSVPWDVAAGALLVTEAGGKVTDLDGNPWNTSSKTVLATNGRIHDQVLEIVNNDSENPVG